MEGLEHKPFLSALLNSVFGRPIAYLLSLFGVKISNPDNLIPDHIAMAIFVMLFLILLFGLGSRRLKIFPSPFQQILELIYEFFEGIILEFIGPAGRKYIPMLGSLGLFIFISNLLGLVPGFMSPTSNLNVTVGCATFVFLYYHYQGIKAHGLFGYIKHFMGPIWWLSWLFFPVEIISHISRPLTLSIRLFGNILGEELLILVLASLFPFVAPLPIMAFAIITSFVQALVFIFLSIVYIGGAIAVEENEH
ncbi:MAG: F0F1 ATP synthase subunit A [Acidobacteriota bacterium]